MTLLELMVVVAIIGIVAALAVPSMLAWSDDERVKAAARSVADAFTLARSEAIRTGDVHLLVFAQGLGATAQLEVVNDGTPGDSNCTIETGEVIHTLDGVQGVQWGTSSAGANGAAVPGDTGAATAGVATGSTFTDGSMAAANVATWIQFQPDGMPRTFTQAAGVCSEIGSAGDGGGAVYITNLRRDYAVVLKPLGVTRVHKWNPSAGTWSN